MAPFKVTTIFYQIKSLINKARAKPKPPVPEAVWKDPLYFIAFGFGSGAMPFAPGTFGTLMAIPFYLLFQSLPLFSYVILVVVIAVLSVWISERVSRDIHLHDHPGMCLDEFVGFFVTMIHAPHGYVFLLLGFLLFRLFDILKPWPIYVLDEKVHGGLGMVLDDIVAGIFACIILQIIAMIA